MESGLQYLCQCNVDAPLRPLIAPLVNKFKVWISVIEKKKRKESNGRIKHSQDAYLVNNHPSPSHIWIKTTWTIRNTVDRFRNCLNSFPHLKARIIHSVSVRRLEAHLQLLHITAWWRVWEKKTSQRHPRITLRLIQWVRSKLKTKIYKSSNNNRNNHLNK